MSFLPVRDPIQSNRNVGASMSPGLFRSPSFRTFGAWALSVLKPVSFPLMLDRD